MEKLAPQIGENQLAKLRIPTIFGKAFETVLSAAQELQPDAVFCVGQAGRRSSTPEVVGINLREASIPDNAGNHPLNEPVIQDGPTAYFSTLPVREMVHRVKSAGIPCALSYTAGTFVCNDVLYSLLHHFSDSHTLVGFIHVPYLPQQAKENTPSMPEETILRALSLAIEALS